MGYAGLLRDSLQRRNLTVIVGLAFLFPFFRLGSYVNSWLAHAPDALDEVYTVALTVFLVAALVGGRRLDQLAPRPRRWLYGLSGVAGIGGCVVLSGAVPALAANPVVAVAALVGTAWYLATYLVAFGRLSVQGEPGRIAINVLFAFILFLVALVVCSAVGIDSSVVGAWVPVGMLMSARLDEPSADVPGTRATLARLPWVLIVSILGLIYVTALILVALTGNAELDPTGLSGALAKAAISAPLALVLVAVFGDSPYAHSKLVIAFGVTLVFYSAVLLFVYFFPVYRDIVSALKYCLRTLLWLTIACSVCERRIAAAPAFALFGLGTLVITRPLTFGLNYQQGPIYRLLSSPYVAPVLAVLLFVVITTTVVLLVRHYVRMQEAPAPGTPDEAAADRTALLRAQALVGADLTPRELEITLLAYRGRSARRIADTLCVAESTVRGHLMHAYRKLGVHSKQELIDLVEQGRTSCDPHA